MSYEIEILPSAQRELKALPIEARDRVNIAIQALALNPRPPGARAMQGAYRGCLRVRVGSYRIIYRIDDTLVVVTVVQVGHRRDIYRQL